MIAISKRRSTRADRYPERLKRSFDIVLSGALALVLLPLEILVAIAVKLSSPGPVFFRQQRVGKDGRLFTLYKFRTMRMGDAGPNVTASGDSRITPLGRLLRKLKIDEYPQLLNVIKGDMSLVGPRPEVPEYVDHYTEEQKAVLSVRPGITGLAQIEYRNEEELLAGQPDVRAYYLSEVMPRKLEIDLRYLNERSLLLDVKILLRTAAAVLRR